MKPDLRLYLTTIVLLSAMLLHAKPAYKGTVILSQPDGKKISAILSGDEFSKLITDTQGHALVRDADGFYCYAQYGFDGTVTSSGFRADEDAPGFILSRSMQVPKEQIAAKAQKERSIAETARSRILKSNAAIRTKATDGSNPPVKKTAIVILAEFKDVKMTYTPEDFKAMLYSKGYSYNGASGSVMEYLEEQFRGDYTFSFTVSPVVTLDNAQSYYFSNTSSGNRKDKNAVQAIVDACLKASEAGMDFSLFDEDGDSEVDDVVVFFAGKDEADGGGEECPWSHQWWVKDGEGVVCELDGKTINRYVCTTELGRNSSGGFTFTGIGTFCHEFSHTLGLSDMYDTDDAASGGIANGLFYTTGLMDGGCHNNFGMTPPHYSAIDYDSLGAGECELMYPGEYTLEPINRNRRYLKFETGNEGEYFLFEVRRNTGWDAYIGGMGLAIYHIDRSTNDAEGYTAARRWMENTVNCAPAHECARFVSAYPDASAFDPSGKLNPGVASMIFFPYSDHTSFTPDTSPAFRFWNGDDAQFAVTDISIKGDNVSFKVISLAGLVIPEVENLSQDVFQDASITRWSASDPKYDGEAIVSWGESSGEQTTIMVRPYSQGQYSLTLDNLLPRTAYKLSIRFGQDDILGPPKTANFTTKSMYDGAPFIYLAGVTRNENGTFPKGVELPLRIYNLKDAAEVKWYLNGRPASTDGSGYLKVWNSATLSAEIYYNDGSVETIMKKINVE